MIKNLRHLKVYKESLELSHSAWNIYTELPQALKFDIGSQFIRAVDSIGANIAEGFGRFHYKDKIKFYYNARGSLWESKHWIYLLHKRKLISKEQFDSFIANLNNTGKLLNSFIKATGTTNA